MASTPQQTRRRKIPAWLFPSIGYVLSIASLIWIFRNFDVKQAIDDFTSMDWRFVTLAVIADLFIYVVGGWRWNILLRPVVSLGLWRTVHAIYIGLYANEILPLRPGELIRCYLMAHWNNLPMSLVISSAAIERILEGIWMVTALAVTAYFINLPALVTQMTTFVGIAVLCLSAVLILIGRSKRHAEAAISAVRLPTWLMHVIDSIHAMENPRTMAWASFASFLYLAIQIVPVWALLQGYGLDLSVWAASTVLIIIRMGTIVPSLPGNAGLYQAMCIVALGLFGVERSKAVGFSVMMFGVLTLPLLIGGFIAVALSGVKLQDIRARANRSVETRSVEVTSE